VLELPSRERRPVRVYTVAVAIGVMVTAIQFTAFELPIISVTVYRGATEVVDSPRTGSLPQAVDGALLLAVTFAVQAVYVRTLIRQRRARRR